MKKIAITMATLFALGAADIASARDQNKDAIAARKAAFTLFATNMGPMGAMAKGQMPFSKEAFAQRAANLEALAKMPWEFFIPGSDKGNTEAKAQVWSKADAFKSELEKFQNEAAKLALVSRSGDEKAMYAQLSATAKTCKSCHDGFKTD